MKQVRVAQYLVSKYVGLVLISGIAFSPVQAQPAVDTAKPAENTARPPSAAPGKPQDKNGVAAKIVTEHTGMSKKPPVPNQRPVKR